jgi:predicted nucleotide-binding protein
MAGKNDVVGTSKSSGDNKRKYLSQTDVPGLSLEQAVRVPAAITENYANGPVTPLQLASALDMSPTSGTFRTLCGAAIAYGLTDGGPNAQEIALTELGRRITKPLEEGDDVVARREALLKPRVVGEFLNQYNSSPLPRLDIAKNVLESKGVPSDKSESVFELIVESARAVGVLREIKGKLYVDLVGVDQSPEIADDARHDDSTPPAVELPEELAVVSAKTERKPAAASDNRRVFITHGKNTEFIDPLKKLLAFGELTPVVSVEKQSVSKPVPDKVMDDMRSCGAAIIHVEGEQKLLDKDLNEHAMINPNVLIEIGAAMALYGRRFILLVKEGTVLPSNLQGLYEVRYTGDSLDGNATIKLLEAINDIKNHPLPGRGESD